MKRVLLLSAGRRVSLLRGFQERVAAAGGEVIAADMRPDLSAACQVAGAHFRVPHVLSDDYPEALMEICRTQDVALVVPTIDTELPVLARLRPRFAAAGVEILVCDEPIVSLCADKRLTARFFAERGLSTPAIYSRDEIDYPVLVKPFDGSLGAGVVVLRGPEDMSQRILADIRNIFCQYIDHADHSEYTVDLYYDRRGRLRCVVPRRRIEVRGGEVSKGQTEKNEIVELLFERLGRIEGARGCLTLQLFRHHATRQIWCIEINARFGGGYPLTRLAGADFQGWLVAEYLCDEAVPMFREWRDRTLMLRYDCEVIVDDNATI